MPKIDKKAVQPDVKELEAKCREYLSGWQRAQADYDNLKKETDGKVKSLVEYSTAGIILEALSIYNHFKMALTHQPEIGDRPWLAGLDHIKKEFEQFLNKFEIEEVKTVGEVFNPAVHEAVGSEESTEPDNQVIKEARSGYLIKGKVIQPAQVIISKNINKINH